MSLPNNSLFGYSGASIGDPFQVQTSPQFTTYPYYDEFSCDGRSSALMDFFNNINPSDERFVYVSNSPIKGYNNVDVATEKRNEHPVEGEQKYCSTYQTCQLGEYFMNENHQYLTSQKRVPLTENFSLSSVRENKNNSINTIQRSNPNEAIEFNQDNQSSFEGSSDDERCSLQSAYHQSERQQEVLLPARRPPPNSIQVPSPQDLLQVCVSPNHYNQFPSDDSYSFDENAARLDEEIECNWNAPAEVCAQHFDSQYLTVADELSNFENYFMNVEYFIDKTEVADISNLLKSRKKEQRTMPIKTQSTIENVSNQRTNQCIGYNSIAIQQNCMQSSHHQVGWQQHPSNQNQLYQTSFVHSDSYPR